MEEIVKNEFQFYSKLARPLVLNLPKSKDRILAAAWIKKFRDETSGEEKLRTTYLKLLLFCLQRRRLTGIFADDPSNYPMLEQLPPDIDLNEFARNLLEQERTERIEIVRLEMMGDMDAFPVFTTDCSPDLTEYVAAQDIPNFGVHAYYAISKQPVNRWQRSEKAILPKGTKSAVETSMQAAAATAASCVCSPKGTASAPEVEEGAVGGEEPDCRKKDKTPEKKKRRSRKLGTSPPTHPIGEVRQPAEERITPTWGTNLVEIKERTDIGNIEEPSSAAIALDQEVSRMMEEEEAEDEEEDKGPGDQDTVASKAQDMIHVLDEFKFGKMDKPKLPSRLAKMGDRSRIKAPKSIKAPKIAVKGMKKGKGKGGLGPKPADLPEEFADWTEKELLEAGLTWADLMPVEENVDDELQRLEDEELGGIPDEELQIEELQFEGYQEFDLDAMLREAEADLAAHKSIYDVGVEEDENIVELFDDELEDLEEQLNVSRAAEEVRTASPALTSGIPVTTPQRSASPKRFKSPEKVFAQEDDDLLVHRESPLRPPKPKKKIKSGIAKRMKRPSEPTDKDPNISKVFKKASKIVKKHKRPEEGEEEEFERLEREYQREEAMQGGSRRGAPSPARYPDGGFSPGEADRVRQRAQQQEQLLRSPQQGFNEDEEFERFEKQFQHEECAPCSPARYPEPPPGDEARMRQRVQQQEQLLRTPEQHAYEPYPEDLEATSPCHVCDSPPGLTEEEEFEMYERHYQQQSPSKAGVVRSPTTGQVLPIPDFNYGPADVGQYDPRSPQIPEFNYRPEDLGLSPGAYQDADDSLGLLSPSVYQTPPRQASAPGYQGFPALEEHEEMLHRKMTEIRVKQQEASLRQGSPEANQIIQEAEQTFGGNVFHRVAAGHGQMIEGSPPPGIHSPVLPATPPKPPLTSPTTGAILDVPQFDIHPDDLGVEWDDPDESLGILPELYEDDEYIPSAQSLLDRQIYEETTDIFERCGGLGASHFPPPVLSPTRSAWQPTPPRGAQQAAVRTPATSSSPPRRSPSPLRQSPCSSRQSPSPPRQFPGPPPFPGMSAPVTPVRQRPITRPPWYQTPTPVGLHGPEERPIGYRSPMVTPKREFGPRERPKHYYTPEEDLKYDIPVLWDGMNLDEIEQPDFGELPVESPGPCTPCGGVQEVPATPRRGPSPRRAGRRRPAGPSAPQAAPPSHMDRSPVMPQRPMKARKLFDGDVEEPCDPCGPVIRPPEPCGPCGQQDPDAQERARRKPRSRHRRKRSRRRSPEDDFEELEELFNMEEASAPPCAREPLPEFKFSPGEADRVRQRARQQESSLRTPSMPPEKAMQQELRLTDSPPMSPRTYQAQRVKDATPPTRARTPPRVSPAWSTPPGQAGPSRRQTGRTPPVYDSDFSPPSTPPKQTTFPRVKRFKKKGKYPAPVQGPCQAQTPGESDDDFEALEMQFQLEEGTPCPAKQYTPDPASMSPCRATARVHDRARKQEELLTSPRTPTDQRRMPSPPRGRAQRPPFAGGEGTPTRRQPPGLVSRRMFEEPGRTPRLPEAESPLVHSPWTSPCPGAVEIPFYTEPLIEDEEPPEDMPPYVKTLRDDQMYFPGEIMDTETPERLPTMPELKKHELKRDIFHQRISHLTPFGRGPGPMSHREGVSAFQQMDRIPEYESDLDWQGDILTKHDLDTYNKYFHKPPSSYPAKIERKHFTFPPQKFKSPRASPEREPPGYGNAFQEILQANLRVPPEQYPPPVTQPTVCPGRIAIAAPGAGLGTFDAEKERYEAFLAASQQGKKLLDYVADRDFQDIADQADLMFDYEGGLFDTSPPPVHPIDYNYYPDIMAASQDLASALGDYDFPQTPPRRVAPKTPSPQRAPSPGPGPCGTARPCDAAGAIPRKPSEKRIPPQKQLRETRSSVLRKEKMAKEKEAQQKKERAAQAAIDKKTQIRDKKRAEARKKAEAQAREAQTRAAIKLPGERMRPLDYRSASGSGIAVLKSAEKQPSQVYEDEAERIRKKLFMGPQATVGSRRGVGRPQTDRRLEGKFMGRKRPSDPRGVCDPCGALPTQEFPAGPDFLEELQGHKIKFPGYRKRIVVKGKAKPLKRRGRFHFDQMDHIQEDEDEDEYTESPCGTCDEGDEEDDGQQGDDEELAEFEALERQFAAEEGEVCGGAGSPIRPTPPRRSPCRAEGITYSPSRPQPTFGPPREFMRPGGHLPIASPPRRSASSPPCAPSPPALPRELENLDFVSPPVFEDMPEEDRLQHSDMPHISSPSSPPLTPKRVRREVFVSAWPRYAPELRRDIIPRRLRRTVKAPCGMANVQEEEPLIPSLAVPEPARKRRGARRERTPERPRRKKETADTEVSRYVRQLEERFNLTPEASPERPYSVLDESLPKDLPGPMYPHRSPVCSPLQRLPLVPIPPWEEPDPAQYKFMPPAQTEFYVPPADLPIHPDLVELASWEPPMTVPEGVDLLMDEQPVEEMFFTPPRYPETDEMELDRQAMLSYNPPRVLKNTWLATHEEAGMYTPPSVGKGPCGTYSPTGSPPLGLLDPSELERLDDNFLMTPPGSWQQDIQDFYAGTPPLETETSMHTQRAEGIRPQPQYAEESERMMATSPAQLEFDQLEQQILESDQRKKVSKRGRRRLDFDEIHRKATLGEMTLEAERMEMEFGMPPSPTVRSKGSSRPSPCRTPPGMPFRGQPIMATSPDQLEFDQLEQQIMESDQRKRVSKRGRRRLDFDEIHRKATLGEMTLEAERMEMEFGMPPSPTVRSKGSSRPSPCRTPPGMPFLGEPDQGMYDALAAYQSPEPLSKSWSELASCGSPVLQMDQEGIEQLMLEEMGFDPNADYPLEEPRSPQMLDEAFLEGYDSPEPLSRSWSKPASCGSPVLQMDQEGIEQHMLEEMGFDPNADYPLEEPRSPQMLDEAFLEGYDSPEPLSRSWSKPASCGSPVLQMDQEGIEQRMLEEMGFDPNADYPLEEPTSPQMLDQAFLEEYESPEPLSRSRRKQGSPCSPVLQMDEAGVREAIGASPIRGRYMPPSSPSHPMPAELSQAAKEANAIRRQQCIEREDREIREMFGPSPGPPSPGPDPDFMARVYGHHVPDKFRAGARRPCVVRDQIGKKELKLKLARKSRPPGLQSIAELGARVQYPEDARDKRRQWGAPAQRLQAPAQVSRRQAPCGGAQQQQGAAASCSGAIPKQYSAAEAQKRAIERSRITRRQDVSGPSTRTPRGAREPPPPPTQQFSGSRSSSRVRQQEPSSRQGQRPAARQTPQGAGGCGGSGRSCGDPGPSGASATQPEMSLQDFLRRGGTPEQGQRECPRRQVRKTSSTKKIVTKRN